jgi:hypothetical protein
VPESLDYYDEDDTFNVIDHLDIEELKRELVIGRLTDIESLDELDS